MGAVPPFKGHHWSHTHITQYALTEVCARLVTVNKFSTLYSFYVTQLQPKNSSEPFSPSHLPFTLLIKSPRLYAMIPFFKLRSAFVTLKGLGRDARPVRSCCVMEALAVTHLQTATSHILCSFFSFLEQHIQLVMQCLLLGEGRCCQDAEGFHCVIHLSYLSPATEAVSVLEFWV